MTAAASAWYHPDDIPSGSVHGIRVRWAGYEVEAATAVDKKGRRTWYEVRGRELRPIRADVTGWQPTARGWQWPNGLVPQPLPQTVTPCLSSVEATFDATLAAEEMQAERDALSRGDTDAEPRESAQWWRDVTRILYEPMGSVTREHGEARILRALILERSIRLDLAPYRTNAAALAALKLTLADVLAEAPSEDWVPPLVMQPQDHADFDTVMGWLVEVMPSRRQVHVLRGRMLAPPVQWVVIGDQIGRSEARAREMYAETIDALVAAANVPPRRAVARLAELQARNREARR